MAAVPEDVIELARRWPASQPARVLLGADGKRIDMATLLEDLAAASEAYRITAESRGPGDHWRVFLEIEKLRDRSLAQSLADMTPQQRRWLAVWALKNGEPTIGLEAYAAYLRDPGPIGPLASENVLYLQALASAGRHADCARVLEDLAEDEADLPYERGELCLAMAERGEARAALDVLAPVRRRYHDDGRLWAITAILQAKAGDELSARRSVEEAAKQGLLHDNLVERLRDAVGMKRTTWDDLVRRYAPPDEEAAYEAWRADAGLRPFRTADASPHHFGGRDFQMPRCRGCGHPIRQWFGFDLREIAPLHERLPDWGTFPLLGCADCGAWMGRHDYRLDSSERSIELVNVATSSGRYGEAFGTLEELPEQLVALTAASTDEEGPQVGGAPPWTQETRRIWCWSCGEEMVFVAAMASTGDFGPYVPINNESGYQYHFACSPCHAISVIAQWT